MSDFTNNKPVPYSNFPETSEKLTVDSVSAGSGFNRVEGWITPERLRNEWLFGIPLVSPVTQQVMTDDLLKTMITKAATRVELECNVDVYPVTRVKRQNWDRTKSTQGFNQIDLGTRQIKDLLEVSIRGPNSMATYNGVATHTGVDEIDGSLLYKFPLDWIDLSLARKGIIHFVPLQSAISGTIPGGIVGGAAAPLMAIMSQLSNIPGYWFIRWTSGFEENSIPSPINDLIGVYTALDILSMLGPTNKYNSQSIGLDAASQSVSGPGNQLFALRVQDLKEKAEQLKDLIKAKFTNKIVMRNI